MKPNYKKLWKLMIDKDVSKTELRRMTGMSTTTLAKLGKGEMVSLALMRKICEVLDCNIGDVMDFIHEADECK